MLMVCDKLYEILMIWNGVCVDMRYYVCSGYEFLCLIDRLISLYYVLWNNDVFKFLKMWLFGFCLCLRVILF